MLTRLKFIRDIAKSLPLVLKWGNPIANWQDEIGNPLATLYESANGKLLINFSEHICNTLEMQN
jgi:hypothetical protein